MDLCCGNLCFFIMLLLFLHQSNVEGRYHFHKNKSPVSDSPVSAPPNPESPVSQSPPYPPPIPSDPNNDPIPEDPNDPGNSTSDCVFDVTSFGAIGDGSTDDTAAFRDAWKAACAVESAVLLAPADYTFMITSTVFYGPCKPGLVFQVDGVLMPPNGPDCWPKEDSNKQWLVFYRLDDMTFTGNGTIEGNGEQWWELPCKPHRGPHGSTLHGPCDSPALIRFFMSSNLVVSGLRIQNSPQFHMKFDGCEGVLIEKLSISSPKLSPNTDGIHIENTKSVGIYDSVIENGDDCISIGPGCANVNIDGVTCGPSHGISIGSLGVHNSQACVSNITVRNAVIKDSDNGVRIKTWQGGAGSVTGISFEDIQMDNVRNCVIIDQYYCSTQLQYKESAEEMPSLQTALPPELANNAIRLYRECLRRAKYIGSRQHNTPLLVEMVRQQFRKHMHETDLEKIQKLKDDAARGLINHMLYESEKMSGRKFSQTS